jgi:hypothetical protein
MHRRPPKGLRCSYPSRAITDLCDMFWQVPIEFGLHLWYYVYNSHSKPPSHSSTPEGIQIQDAQPTSVQSN